MPFIRYAQSDLAVYRDPEARDGQVERRIVRIEGRDDDYVLLPDGRRGSFDAIYSIVDEYMGITQYRLVQETRTRFRIQLSGNPDYLSSIREELTRRLAQTLECIRFDVVPVERIDPDPSGKIRLFVSEAV